MEMYANQLAGYLFAQSWQIALLAATVGLISFALRHRSAHIRYLLWLIVLAKCLVPPVYSVPVAVLPQRPPTEYSMLPELPRRPAGEPVVVNAGEPVIVEQVLEPRQAKPASPSATDIIILVWLAGVLVFLLWILSRAVRYTLWLQRRRAPLAPDLYKAFEELFEDFKIKKSPRIWLTKDIAQPFVWGLFRGSIYLPSDFTSLDGSQHNRTVLAHELGHIARFDAAINIIQILAQAIFWFHPFVWWANKKIRSEREKCCDEIAVAHLSAPPEHYTDAIVEALAAERRSAHPVPLLAIVGSVKDIEERIKTMLRPGKKFYKRPSVRAIIILLLVAAFTIPIGCALTNRSENETATEQEGAHYATLFDAAQAGDLAEVKRFIDEGADVNAKERGMWTPLMYAAMSGNKDVAELLLSEGADVDTQASDGETALLQAVWEGNKDIINLLLSKGADINLTPGPDKIYPPPLHYAVWKEDLDTVRFLYDRGAKSDIKDFVGYTALRYAAAQGQKDMVELFLSEEFDKSGIHVAACAGDLTRVKELIEQGTEVDTKDEKGWTALFWAASTGQTEVAEFLIDNGADISANDSLGRSLLYQAVQSDAIKLVEFLIDKGADINAKNIRGDASLTVYVIGATPLHLAAQVGYKDIVELLITKGADVNTKTEGRMNFLAGQTPLHLACQSGNKEIVELLIDNGADINVENNREQTPLDIARSQESSEITDLLIQHNAQKSLPDIVTSGDIEELRLRISQGADINATSGGVLNFSLLYLACQSENIEIIELLINSGADVNARTALDGIPLFLVCRSGNKEIVELLIDEGADVNVENINGRTPLGIAEEGDHSEIIEMLLQHGARKSMSEAVTSGDIEELRLRISQGADINATRGGFNPSLLHLACQNENIEIIELLINSGADINATTRYGQTPLDTAEEYGYTEIVELLVQNGAQKSSSTLLGAINSGDIEQVKLLISQGADVDVKNNRGGTPLNVVSQRGNKDIVEMLIDSGANINNQNNGGLTPLHQASRNGLKEIVELLVEKGADVNIKNNAGQTPLDLAQSAGHTEIVELLKQHGAKRGTPTLFGAFEAGDIEQVKLLISQGADVNAKNEEGKTPLHLASMRHNRDVINLLLEEGAEVDAKDNQGNTALYYGIGDINIVRLLVENGANVNASLYWDSTPLEVAVWDSNIDVIKLLIENNARFDIEDQIGWTAFRWAASQGDTEIIDLFISNDADVSTFHLVACAGDLERVQEFLEQGKVIDEKDAFGWTPLLWAVSCGRQDVAEFLINSGADTDVTLDYPHLGEKDTLSQQATKAGAERVLQLLISRDGSIDLDMLLLCAAKCGRLNMVELLLQKGVDVDVRDDDGLTPLYWAVVRRHDDIAATVLVGGADVNIKDSGGRTLLWIANQIGNKKIIELLREHGAEE